MGTRFLPSEERQNVIKAIDLIQSHLEISGHKVTLYEPCDCGSHGVRHNNGGNYHDIVQFACDGGLLYRRDTSTYEDAEWGYWQVTTTGEIEEFLRKWIPDGWTYYMRGI